MAGITGSGPQLWLHSNIGYVLQNPHLFSGSIKENIRYGRLNSTDAEIEAAAKAVSADTVVENWKTAMTPMWAKGRPALHR